MPVSASLFKGRLRAFALPLLLLSLTLSLPGGAFANDAASEAAVPANATLQTQETIEENPAQPPAIETQNKIDAQKLQVAKELTDWLNRTLQEKQALVAIVGRNGSVQTRKQDETGMGHGGLAVYDPRAQSWLVYNLLNDVRGKAPQGSIWRTAPLDFFYGQTGYDKEALILIPDKVTQQRLYESILNGNYKKLFITRNYNLLSPPDTARSLNCNKWLLLNVVAASLDNYDPQAVLSAIHNGFEPDTIHLNPIERQFAKGKPTVMASDIPTFGPIQTITMESLYRSGLFPEKRFYSGKSL